jgi:cell division protein ZapB
MTHEFDALENKIAQVVSLCRVLRSENNSLRERLVVAEAEKHGLAERVEVARDRIEQLVQQLPETKTLS